MLPDWKIRLISSKSITKTSKFDLEEKSCISNIHNCNIPLNNYD